MSLDSKTVTISSHEGTRRFHKITAGSALYPLPEEDTAS